MQTCALKSVTQMPTVNGSRFKSRLRRATFSQSAVLWTKLVRTVFMEKEAATAKPKKVRMMSRMVKSYTASKACLQFSMVKLGP